MQFKLTYKFIILSFLLASQFLFSDEIENVEEKKTLQNIEQTIQDIIDNVYTTDEDDRIQISTDLYLRGTTSMDEESYLKAIYYFETALKYDKASPIYFSLAEAYTAIQDYNNAIINSSEAYLLDTTSIKALKLLFSSLIYKYDYKNAEKVLLEINQKAPEVENKLLLADFYAFTEPIKAIEIYQEMLSQQFSDDVNSKLIGAYFQNSDTLSALDLLYKTNVAKFSSNKLADLLYFSAISQSYDYVNNYYLHEYEGLSEENKLVAFELLIDYYYDFQYYLKLPKEQVSDMFKLLNSNKPDGLDDALSNINASELALTVNDTNLVVKYLKKSIELTDTLSRIPILVALGYNRILLENEALDVLLKYKDQFPENEFYDYYIAYTCSLLEKNEEALELMLKYYKKQPENIETIIFIADLYSKINQTKKAIEFYEIGLKLDPNDATVNNNYAYLLSDFPDKLQEAKKLSEKSLSLEPDNPAFQDTYGWIMFLLEDYTVAKKYFNRAIKSEYKGAEIYYHLSELYTKLNNLDNALFYINKAIELENNEEYIKIKNELENLTK